MRFFLVALVFAAATAIASAAAPLSPSAIVANPKAYDGKTVTVAGKVGGFQTSSTLRGTVAGFQLCDAKCVVVIDETNQKRSNGDKATVTGTFHLTFSGPRRSFTNAVVVGP